MQKIRCGPRHGLIEKLRPGRLRVSPKLHAILGCLLGQAWATPRLTGLRLTRDGHLLGRIEGDLGYDAYLGAEADLIRNLKGVLFSVGASETEAGYLLGLVEACRH